MLSSFVAVNSCHLSSCASDFSTRMSVFQPTSTAVITWSSFLRPAVAHYEQIACWTLYLSNLYIYKKITKCSKLCDSSILLFTVLHLIRTSGAQPHTFSSTPVVLGTQKSLSTNSEVAQYKPRANTIVIILSFPHWQTYQTRTLDEPNHLASQGPSSSGRKHTAELIDIIEKSTSSTHSCLAT